MKNAGDERRYRVPALERTVRILAALREHDAGLTFNELGSLLKFPKSSLYSLLQTLESYRLVDRDEASNRYRIGLRCFEFGSGFPQHQPFLPVFLEVGAQLAKECRETIELAIRDGRDIVYLSQLEGGQPTKLVSAVGRRLPAHATALGKVLLSELPEDEVRGLYDGVVLESYTANTITTMEQLVAELEVIRGQGYAVNREELTPGLFCFAAPVHGARHQEMAALSIAVPRLRLTGRRQAELTELVRNTAMLISHRMGYSFGRVGVAAAFNTGSE